MKPERRFEKGIEIRQEGDKPPVIRGYAARFNSLSSNLGGFVEKIAPGAFTKAVSNDDVRALVGHDPDKIIGRTKSGTLELREDDNGLYCEIHPPDTQAGRDIVESIKRGDIDGMSFGFGTVDDSWGTTEDGQALRELREVRLYDVSAVTYPAYPSTSVQVRSLLFPEGLPKGAEERASDMSKAMECVGRAMELHKEMSAEMSSAAPALVEKMGQMGIHLADAHKALSGEPAALDISGNIQGGGDDKTQQESRETKQPISMLDRINRMAELEK